MIKAGPALAGQAHSSKEYMPLVTRRAVAIFPRRVAFLTRSIAFLADVLCAKTTETVRRSIVQRTLSKHVIIEGCSLVNILV